MTETSDEAEAVVRVRNAVHEMLSAPASYRELRAGIDSIQRVAREEFAAAIRDPLNREAAVRPHATYAEKRELANWINAELRGMGLALKCPRSGLPSILHASIGHLPEVGRFRFDSVDETGRRNNYSASVDLPHLEPVPDPALKVPLRTRRDRSR